MSWHNCDDLMDCLRTQRIRIDEVRVGDILATEFGPRQVSRIEVHAEPSIYSPRPCIMLYDSHESTAGGENIEGSLDIISRDALDYSRCMEVLEADRRLYEEDKASKQ